MPEKYEKTRNDMPSSKFSDRYGNLMVESAFGNDVHLGPLEKILLGTSHYFQVPSGKLT
jgi:tetrahydromethanopterin S-methyltransferase subunit E